MLLGIPTYTYIIVNIYIYIYIICVCYITYDNHIRYVKAMTFLNHYILQIYMNCYKLLIILIML